MCPLSSLVPLAICFLGATSASSVASSQVTKLSVATWESTIGTELERINSLVKFISSHQSAYVYFYTLYSAHCKLTNTLYNEAAAALEDDALQTRFVSIDCPDSGLFCSDISVNAYPTLRHYHGGDGQFDEIVGSKNIAELVSIVPALDIGANLLYIRKISELTAGRVTLKKPPLPTKSVATPVVPERTGDVSPEHIYLTDDGLSALFKLKLPDLGADAPVFLNFTISANRHHLLLNNELFALLVPTPSVPARLRAQQMVSNSKLQATGSEISLHEWLAGQVTEETLALDYEFTMNNRDDPSIRYYNYHPVLHLSIIGVRYLQDGSVVETQPQALLDGTRGQQKIVEVQMQQHKSSPLTLALPPKVDPIIHAKPTEYRLAFSTSLDDHEIELGTISSRSLTVRKSGKESPNTGAHFCLYSHGAFGFPCRGPAKFAFAQCTSV